MSAPVRFAYANARLRALERDLWDETRIARVRAAPALCLPPGSDELGTAYAPLMRWYATLLRACPPSAPVLLPLVRRHEIENLKLLWRAAVRERSVPLRVWRPLGPVGTLAYQERPRSLAALVEGLRRSPYARVAAETARSHGADLAAAELALDGWAASAVRAAADSLPAREAPARDLLLWLLRERDLDLLGRAVATYRLEPAFAAGLTTLLKDETRADRLIALARWRPSAGPLAEFLPPVVAVAVGSAASWTALMTAVRAIRMAGCRRAVRLYPFQLAPAIAALLLREEQVRLAVTLAGRWRAAVAPPAAPARTA